MNHDTWSWTSGKTDGEGGRAGREYFTITFDASTHPGFDSLREIVAEAIDEWEESVMEGSMREGRGH